MSDYLWPSLDPIVPGPSGEPTCAYCGVTATDEFGVEAKIEGMTPTEYAREDGTYNSAKNQFACDSCYINIGMPSGPRGWTV